MSIVESKSLLAKLLAEENISVQHQKTQTAYFDVKNRILVCPILKDMPDELYDLLMGHEVGHALFTPAQGWHDALKKTEGPGFRSFLNVVEDARIERKIKGRFPGIRPSFFKGYKNLFDRDFFGVKDTDLTKLPLIDRVNLHYKLGTLVNITFDSDEQYFIDLIDDAETWEDVVYAAEQLYAHAKQRQQEQLAKTSLDDLGELSDELTDNKEEGDSDDFDYVSGKESDEDDLDDLDSEGHDYTGGEAGDRFDDLFSEPTSITDSNFRKRETELVDEACVPIIYVKTPKVLLKNTIVPHKAVHDAIEKSCKETCVEAGGLYKYLDVSTKGFYEKNNRYINYLVKEFELRKNAKQFARASVNKTGELDMSKIAKHKLTEDIFRRVTIVPQGKNHGLLLFLDLSGSMSDSFLGTVEQLLILTSFCRKVSIPFEVYGFSDHNLSKKLLGEKVNESFEYSPGDIYMGVERFHLKQYFSSTMSRLEFNRAVLNMLTIGAAYKRNVYHLLPTEQLNGTPLNSAIIASIEIAQAFQKANRIEVLTTMFLTDGDAGDEANTSVTTDGYTYFGTIGRKYNLNISHRSGPAVQISGQDPLTKGLLLLAKKITKANLIGFYITGRSPYKSDVRKLHSDYNISLPADFDDAVARARKNKFYQLLGSGYDFYFVVPPGDEMIIRDRGIMVDSNATKTEIRRAFMNNVKSRAVNRVFLSRFCNTICQSL